MKNPSHTALQNQLIKALDDLLSQYPTLTFCLYQDTLLDDFVLEVSCKTLKDLEDNFHKVIASLDEMLENEHDTSLILACEGEWNRHHLELLWEKQGRWADKTYSGSPTFLPIKILQVPITSNKQNISILTSNIISYDNSPVAA